MTAFFREVPMPAEAYPLAAMVVGMSSFAAYSAFKHIRADRDHVSQLNSWQRGATLITEQLRWYPGAGAVRYVEPELKELPLNL